MRSFTSPSRGPSTGSDHCSEFLDHAAYGRLVVVGHRWVSFYELLGGFSKLTPMTHHHATSPQDTHHAKRLTPKHVHPGAQDAKRDRSDQFEAASHKVFHSVGLTGFEHVPGASGKWWLTGPFTPFSLVNSPLGKRRRGADTARRTRFRTSLLARIWHAILGLGGERRGRDGPCQPVAAPR